MNIPTHLPRDIQFRSLRRKLGGNALIALSYLGLTYQATKATILRITGPDELLMACDLEGEVEPDVLWGLLIGTWLIEVSPQHYRFPFFEDNNRQLLTLWDNAKHGHKSHSSTKRNETQRKETKKKGTELNRTEPNLTKLDGPPMGAHSLPNGYPMGQSEENSGDLTDSEVVALYGNPGVIETRRYA